MKLPFFKPRQDRVRFSPAELPETTEALRNPARGWYQIHTFPVDREPDLEELGWCLEPQDALALVLTDLRAALEPYGVKLSLLLTENQILEDTSADSGVDLAALLPLVDGVYVQAADPEAVRAALAAPPEAERWPELVLITAEPGGADNWCVPAG